MPSEDVDSGTTIKSLPPTFDEDYFKGGHYHLYQNYAHFRERATWTANNLSGSILEVGCAYGYLILELDKLGISISGVDLSSYAVGNADKSITSRIVIGDIADQKYSSNNFDWIISWNTLECLRDDQHAEAVASVLNNAAKSQLHIISMVGNSNSASYLLNGYFMRSLEYWRKLLPDAVFVCSECRRVYSFPGQDDLHNIPLHFKKGVSY